MPIPQVFGTEHEYVIHCAESGEDNVRKLNKESAVAGEFLSEWKKIFFPNPPVVAPNIVVDRFDVIFPRVEEALAPKISEEERAEKKRDMEERHKYYEFISGFMTPIGGRFYLDHGYFEGCTPECDDPFEIVACELAQEELMADFFERHFADHPWKPLLYKNISDGKGHSQAAHRNFSVSSDFWHRIVSINPLRFYNQILGRTTTRETFVLATWHAVEQIFCGAGAYRDECLARRYPCPHGENGGNGSSFRISGRSDFTERILGDSTIEHRPIINTRYEPLAAREYGRYHCICGDANRSDWSSVFKTGLLALVLGMMEDDAFPMDCFAGSPCRAMHDISHDPTLQTPIRMVSFRGHRESSLTPIELARMFLEGIRRYLGSHSCPPWAFRVHEKANWTLWALEREPKLLESVLDWKIKDRYCGNSRDPFARHLYYHALTGPVQLYRTLCEQGRIERIIPRDAVEARKKSPPETTRAYFRGNFLKFFPQEPLSFCAGWDYVNYYSDKLRRYVSISLEEPKKLTKHDMGGIFEEEAHPSFDALMERLRAFGVLRERERKGGQ